MSGLDGVLAKLARVDEHLEQLNAEIGAYMAAGPFVARGGLDTGRYSARVFIEKPPPLRASVIVGDIVHNARSALDHLLWQLVLAAGHVPDRQQWPISTVRPSNRDQCRQYDAFIAGISPAARELVDATQPYQREDSPELHVLYALRELSNTDKHRLPLSFMAAIEDHEESPLDLTFDDVDLGDTAGYKLVIETPLESGDEFMFIEGVRVTGPNPHITPSGSLPLQVAFGAVRTTAQGLLQIRDYVRMVVDDCAALLA